MKMHPEAMRRHQLLEMLYLAFAKQPRAPWVHIKQLETLGDIEFPMASLQQLGLAETNGHNWRITGAGMLAYEAGCGAD